MSNDIDKLKQQEALASRRFQIAKNVLYAYIVCAVTFVMIQSVILANDVKQDNVEQHAKTQRYIRCIAETLTKPLEARGKLDLESCQTKSEKAAGAQSTTESTTQADQTARVAPEIDAVVTVPRPDTNTASETIPRNIPTTSVPPEDTTHTPSAQTGIVGDVLQSTPDAIKVLLRPLERIGL